MSIFGGSKRQTILKESDEKKILDEKEDIVKRFKLLGGFTGKYS